MQEIEEIVGVRVCEKCVPRKHMQMCTVRGSESLQPVDMGIEVIR
jgi:hypothetical protein